MRDSAWHCYVALATYQDLNDVTLTLTESGDAPVVVHVPQSFHHAHMCRQVNDSQSSVL